jgi:hypothetical protein
VDSKKKKIKLRHLSVFFLVFLVFFSRAIRSLQRLAAKRWIWGSFRVVFCRFVFGGFDQQCLFNAFSAAAGPFFDGFIVFPVSYLRPR